MRETKRPDNIEFAELYKAILADYLAIYPADQLEVTRDSKRVALELRSRGLAFLTLDLPEMGKVLDRSLSEGRLVDHSVPCFGARWNTSPIPRLFSGFWIRLFERSGQLREDIDPDVVFYLRTLLYACKKLNLECKPKRVFDAVKEYFDVESQLSPDHHDRWDEDPSRADPGPSDSVPHGNGELPSFMGYQMGDRRVSQDQASSCLVMGDHGRIAELYAHVVRRARHIVSDLGYFDPAETQGRHGPGAVSEGLQFGTKYMFPTWSPRLEALFPWDAYGVTTVDNFLEGSLPVNELMPREEESASKLIAVPKTQKGPRLIASEPVCNQWVQQGVADLLRQRVASSVLGLSIDFFDQEPSRQDALAASRHGRRSTIDLSSASDRLSLKLVDDMLAGNQSLLSMLAACRTRYLTNPIDKKHPKLLKLRKFASMGSALTFPVQSIVFTILAIGVGSFLHPKASNRMLASRIRVFGDDIILPNKWVETYCELLAHVGLKVNLSKTFTRGNFRESCGMDAWMGYDVTPPYVRWPSAELNSRSAVGYVAVANNFFIKGLWRTAEYLETAANWVRKLPVVNVRAAALGRATFCPGLDPATKVTWNRDTQQWGVRLYRVKNPTPRSYQVDNPNGFMEYTTCRKAHSYSWQDLLFPKEVYFPLSTLHELPPDGSRSVIRRGWTPLAALSAAWGGRQTPTESLL